MAAVGSIPADLKPVRVDEEQGYVDALLAASLQLARLEPPLEVRRVSLRMLQHFLNFRSEKLSSTDFSRILKLTEELGTLDTEYSFARAANPGKHKEHKRGSLRVQATPENLRSLAAKNAITVTGDATGRDGNFDEADNSSEGGSYVYWSSDGSLKSSGSSESGNSSSPEAGYDSSLREQYTDAARVRSRAGYGEMISCHQGTEFSLLVEHNILCEAFLAVTSSCSRIEYCDILPSLLNSLNQICTHPDWGRQYLSSASGLSCLFSDDQFVNMVYHIVRFWEKEIMRFLCKQLKRSSKQKFIEIKYFEHHIVSLLQLFLPLLLEWLQCIHALWNASVERGLSEELGWAKSVDTSCPFGSTDELFCINNEKGSPKKDTRTLLEGIRQSGYNVIGLCMSIENSFSMILDSFSVSVALSKDYGSMEFRHLSKLIRLVIIPLVKNCPCNLWKEWVDNLLKPLLKHCEDILHFTWFSLLHDGRATSYYFGEFCESEENTEEVEHDISEENTEEVEHAILLEFTREVSHLLGVLALSEQNGALVQEDLSHDYKRSTPSQDMESLLSTSLFRYLLLHDCFGGKMRMSLFGYFVDDKAAAEAIPFCRAIVGLAVSSNDMRFKIFILDDLIPCLIRRLHNLLPCAIQRLRCKLSSDASDHASMELVVLCGELYSYMLNSGYLQIQVFAGQDKNDDNAENKFNVWLAKQKKDLEVKAYSPAKELPEGCEWNWEFEEEFQRYLPAYVDMLQEVDAMDGYAEHQWMDREMLFQILNPKFRSKYAINNCMHPYMSAVRSMRQRKYCSMVGVVLSRNVHSLLCKLIKLKPYIKGSDLVHDVTCRLRHNSEIPDEPSFDVNLSVMCLIHSLLFFSEPIFHPMIREGHMIKLLEMVDRLTKAIENEFMKPFLPDTGDFPPHLQPYAWSFFRTRLKEFYGAKKQIQLHEEFDNHLSSGGLDNFIDEILSSKDDSVKELIANMMLPAQFLVLDYDLMKLSFERRAEIVDMQRQLSTYAESLRCLLEDEPLKHRFESLISELEEGGFFDIDNDHFDWQKKSFSKLLDKINDEVFTVHPLPEHYAIRGIIDCRMIFLHKGSNWRDPFEKVVVEECLVYAACLPEFWKVTRFYEHRYYDIVKEPLKQAGALEISVKQEENPKLAWSFYVGANQVVVEQQENPKLSWSFQVGANQVVVEQQEKPKPFIIGGY